MGGAGLTARPEDVSFALAFTEHDGERACADVLGRRPRVTAIVAANDRLAMGCYDALRAVGLTCPADISIVGFNDMPFIERLSPPLTSVRIPQREIGTTAAELLLEQLCDGQAPVRELVLEPALVVRGSTAAPSGGGSGAEAVEAVAVATHHALQPASKARKRLQ